MEPTKRFSVRVGNYVRYRPGYPREVLNVLQQRYDLSPGSEIAEVGSGTGALSRVFLQNRNRVFGVESKMPGTFAFVYFGGARAGPGAWAALAG